MVGRHLTLREGKRRLRALCGGLNTERPMAGRDEATGSFASRDSVGFVAPSGRQGLTQRARRGRDANVRKDLYLFAVKRLGDLCVKTFATFALKGCTGSNLCSRMTRSISLATSPRPARRLRV